jgi:hypothetical protein
MVPAVLAVLLVVGLMVNGWLGGVVLLVPAVFLAWLLALSWPVVSPAGRLMRVVAVLVIVAGAVAKIIGVWA